MSGRQLSLLAGAGSAFLLLAALTYQQLGYAPCELCLIQRWPHYAAVIIAILIAVTWRVHPLAILGLLAAIIASGLGIYHTGVEMALWAGPSHCSGGISDIASMSTQDLMSKIQDAPVTRCNEVTWRFLGLSMASWNAICSAILAVIWAIALRRGRK